MPGVGRVPTRHAKCISVDPVKTFRDSAFGGKNLERDIAMELLIAGSPDLAHAALAEFAQDLVFAKA